MSGEEEGGAWGRRGSEHLSRGLLPLAGSSVRSCMCARRAGICLSSSPSKNVPVSTHGYLLIPKSHLRTPPLRKNKVSPGHQENFELAPALAFFFCSFLRSFFVLFLLTPLPLSSPRGDLFFVEIFGHPTGRSQTMSRQSGICNLRSAERTRRFCWLGACFFLFRPGGFIAPGQIIIFL